MTTAIGVSSGRSARWTAGRLVVGALAVAFGLATLVEGGHVLFGGPAARAEAGDVVSFVLLFNFGAGFAYIVTGVATMAARPWAVWLARALAAATVLVFAAFGVHVLMGGAFEARTAVAMSVRSLFWVAQALTVPGLLRQRRVR